MFKVFYSPDFIWIWQKMKIWFIERQPRIWNDTNKINACHTLLTILKWIWSDSITGRNHLPITCMFKTYQSKLGEQTFVTSQHQQRLKLARKWLETCPLSTQQTQGNSRQADILCTTLFISTRRSIGSKAKDSSQRV